MLSDEDYQHLTELLAVTKKRHDQLELQAAIFGPARVPSEISIELREAKESMERLNAKLRIVTVPRDIQEATGPESSIDVLRLNVKDLKDQLGTMWRYLEGLILEGRTADEAWREFQTSERKKGTKERRVVEIILALGIGVAIYLALH